MLADAKDKTASKAGIKISISKSMIEKNICVYVQEAHGEHADLRFSEFERKSHFAFGTLCDNRNSGGTIVAIKRGPSVPLREMTGPGRRYIKVALALSSGLMEASHGSSSMCT